MTVPFATGEELVALAEGLIYAKKQQAAYSLDLTVKAVERVATGGSLDFGGSEFQEARTDPLSPEKQEPNEPYGWWKLEAGSYLLRFNERLKPPENAVILIVPHERLSAAGASHAPLFLESWPDDPAVLLEVGSGGLAVKENARISKALMIR